MARPIVSEVPTPSVVVGEMVAGESAIVRQNLEELINSVNHSTFDIAELLHKVQLRRYYQWWGYTSFQEYINTLNIKARKAQYLTRLVEVMAAVDVPRATYEPLGVARLREITSLDPTGHWVNPENQEKIPMKDFILGFIEKGESLSMDDLKQHVRTLKGFVGENDLVWRPLRFTRLVAEQTWDPAIGLAKNHIGSVGKDEDGISKDASDSAAAEVIAAEYLNNPANNVSPEEEDNEQ